MKTSGLLRQGWVMGFHDICPSQRADFFRYCDLSLQLCGRRGNPHWSTDGSLHKHRYIRQWGFPYGQICPNSVTRPWPSNSRDKWSMLISYGQAFGTSWVVCSGDVCLCHSDKEVLTTCPHSQGTRPHTDTRPHCSPLMPSIHTGGSIREFYLFYLFYSWSRPTATLACLYRCSGGFYMIQLISVDSRHFTKPEPSLWWSDLHEVKNAGFSIFRPD